MKSLHIGSCVTVGLLLTALLIVTVIDVVAEDASPAVTSPQEAVARAIEFTGVYDTTVQKSGKPDDIVNRVLFRESTVPIQADDRKGRAAWAVKIEDVLFNLDLANAGAERPKELTVYIDSATGSMLQARFEPTDISPDSIATPSIEEMERQLTGFGEKLHGLPEKVPSVNLIEALRKDRFYPLLAKEIVVWYAEYSRDTLEPRAAWIILMLGMPPVSTSEYVRDSVQTDRRLVVDAETGEPLIGMFFGFDRIHEESSHDADEK